jgi:putative heme transporter
MKRRIIAIVITVVVLVAIFAFVLPKIANYGAVWDALRQLTWPELAALGAAELLNLATFGPPYMAVLPGLDYGRASLIALSSTASTYVAPGGAAVGVGVAFAMLRGWGYGSTSVGLAVSLLGIWNQLFMLAAPTVALGLLTAQGGTDTALKTVAAIGLALFVVAVAAFAAALWRDRFARAIGERAARVVDWALRLVHRGPVSWNGESVVRFRRETIGILKRRWPQLTLATLAGQFTVFVLLVVCLRTLGVGSSQVTLTEAFASWTFVRLLGSIPITPGGIGVVELGLTGALVGFGGANDRVVAAVLLYRALTIVPTLVLGLIGAALWRRARPQAAAAA